MVEDAVVVAIQISLQEKDFQCLAPCWSLSILRNLLIKASCELGEVFVFEDVTPGHVSCTWNSDHRGRKAFFLGAGVDCFTIDKWNYRIGLTVKHDERWLAIESANIISIINTIIDMAV